jgi:hypothetical protein
VSRDPTPAQRQAIDARGVDVCVSAGAGSGKTFVLVERFVGLVRDGLEAERILTITFTEKAAREMAERIGARLVQAEPSVAVPDALWVSTIHGFCARLLREHALEAGVDPAFGVLTDVPAARVRRAAFLAAQKAFRAERPGAYDGLVERVRWGKGRDGETRIRELVFQLYEETRAAGARLEPVETLPLDALFLPQVEAAFARMDEARGVYSAAVAEVRRTARRERQSLEIAELAQTIASYPLDGFRRELYRDLKAMSKTARGGGGRSSSRCAACVRRPRSRRAPTPKGPHERWGGRFGTCCAASTANSASSRPTSRRSTSPTSRSRLSSCWRAAPRCARRCASASRPC